MAIAAKLQTEETPAPRTYQERLMNDVDKYISAHRKVEPNVKPLQEVPLDEERIKNIETKLDQVRLLFHKPQWFLELDRAVMDRHLVLVKSAS